MLDNIILKTDSYKVSHYKQYPEGTNHVFSYMEARKGGSLFFGLQYILKRHLVGQVLTKQSIEQADKILNEHLGYGLWNYEGWRNLLEKHNGYLPLEIKAVREGSFNASGTPLITVVNTDPEFYWLTNYIETLLVQTWYPITVATLSSRIKKNIQGYLDNTSDDTNVNFKLHDFGYRGVSSSESAAIGSASHLVNFMGTDTIAGIELLKEYYNAESVGFSIPASEHSTITSWGKDNESKAFENILDKYPSGLVACVSDSFNIYKACEEYWGEELKDKIMSRDGTLVVRPDSGNPEEVIEKILNILGDKFGYSINKKGYKVLPPQIRIIQGDGVDELAIDRILFNMMDNMWAAENIAFGMGGGLLQKLNRDDLSFAFKCSAIEIDGFWNDVYKDPITDSGKQSKRGRLDNENLELVFLNGELLRDQNFKGIKNN